jgi:hypothetical protein
VLLRTAQTSAVEALFTPDKIHHSQELDPALRQYVDFARIWEEGSPNDMRPKNRKWCLQENHELDKEFNSPNALNVTKISRLRYAGHMIRRPEDLRQKALFRAKPNGRRNQGRPKSRWADEVNSDRLAVGVRDWTHCAQGRQTWRDLLQQNLTRYWL